MAVILPFSACADSAKYDVFGMKPGMTVSELMAIVQDHRDWRCHPDGWDEICMLPRVELRAKLTESLLPRAIKLIRVFITTADSEENLLASISSQYGQRVTPHNTKKEPYKYTWSLNNGFVLGLGPLDANYYMDLFDPKLVDGDNAAAQARQVQQAPVPKF
jgi:hypothetical protein